MFSTSFGLVCDDSVNSLLFHEYLSRSSLLGAKLDLSVALVVWLWAGEEVELRSDDVLNSQRAIKEQHDHSIVFLTILSSFLHDPVELYL